MRPKILLQKNTGKISFGKMNNKTKLKDLFTALQKEMEAALFSAKAHGHAPSKGDATELEWNKVLDRFLPARYKADKAFVIDSKDNCSDQIDIAIFDQQYSPFIFKHDSISYIPAESVYAVFEVKQILSKEHLYYASNKAESVRKLHRTSLSISSASGTLPPKKPHHIISGLLTYESSWNPPFGEHFLSNFEGLTGEKHIDLVCSLLDGTVCCSIEDRKLQMHYEKLNIIVFLTILLNLLQAMGTAPMLDIGAYAQYAFSAKEEDS